MDHFKGGGSAFVAPAIIGTLFPTLAGAASGTFLSALGSGLEAFTATFLVESLDAAVAGDFDIGDILKDSAFSGVSAGLTAGINLDTFIGEIPKDSVLNDALISGFGGLNAKLTMKGILDGAIDGAISSGLSSAVYGTDFLEGFSSSVLNTVINLTLADAQFEIGTLGIEDGSFPHILLHGLAGCAAGAVQNGVGGCASGAAGAATAELVATAWINDQLDSGRFNNLSREERLKEAYKIRSEVIKIGQLFGAFAGYLTSGGDPKNVNIGASVGASSVENNACGSGACAALIAWLVTILTVADYALTAKDGYDLTEAALACDQGDAAACNRAKEMATELAQDTGIELTIGAPVPGSKVGIEIIRWLKKLDLDPDTLAAIDRAIDDNNVKSTTGVESPYSGGAHKDTKNPVGDNLDSHHCPAKACYKDAPISSEDGPAIKMDPADHRLTSSRGSSAEAKAYRAEQKRLLDLGKLEEAIQMDIDDIRRIENEIGQPGKYDNAIKEMVNYARTLDPDVFRNR
ncbi:phosphoglycerate kinase [Roseibium sp. TrichSKD4]|uniref:DUF637 domain-containing protein n=1 Tax=Roseibium sp. TrichSKD4 TaxID=744980 RepID=UPI0001E56D4A|nr:DUF637 domain-containing protein [Roseibium sp. TrichSKD4]EFO33270.1 phosphoglycerate kinase [Roseibium sp. TrichSKD4]